MLEIRLLGELDVVRDGQRVPLPASKKARALVAYLVATRKPHLRERLCDLLWDGPDDPRAQLRWTLSKLKPALAPHVAAGREHVEFRADGARVDLDRLCPPGSATTEALEECAALFRGQFVDGLDLPACFRFQQWCTAERERLRQAHVAILAELTRRQGPTPSAVAHARRRIAVDPFSDEAHAGLIRLLAELGQAQDAMRQYEQCRQMFERELGTKPGAAVEEARRTIGRAPASPSVAGGPRAEPAIPLVGRRDELARIAAATGIVVVTGEPGIGKSRLLEEVRARETGGAVQARAFAAEMVRPYGVWIDALRSAGRELPQESDRTRLFDAVVALLAGVGLVTLDDVQWLDEGSAALLHYIARSPRLPRLVCAARSGEIDDNPHVSRVMRDLARERRLTKVALGPLDPGELSVLVRTVAPDADEVQVLAGSGGNPLFAIELSRAAPADGSAPASLSALIAARLDQLDDASRELVAWASVMGRQFDVDVVGRATGMPAGETLSALEKLERCAVIRAAGERTYDFVHDLVRDVAYQGVSGPRRALAHRQVASALQSTHDPEGALAGDILHHATLGGDFAAAAEAAVRAGNRCLRLFAYPEAVGVARRGLQIVDSLGGAGRADLEMRLLAIVVMARTPLKERLPLTNGLAAATRRADEDGHKGTAALGAHLLAVLAEETSQYGQAAQDILRSAELARSADRASAAASIAAAARCLLFLQREVPRAQSLLAEAEEMGVETTELALGWGYLHAHEGRTAEATPWLERAFALAAREQDHWREWVALYRLTALALEDGDAARALQLCARLRGVTAQMAGGSEPVKTEMMETLARFAAGQPVEVGPMLARLREADTMSDLAWALALLAEMELARGEKEAARLHAGEALAAAEAAGRASEAVIARAILARLSATGGESLLPPGRPASLDLTARARRYIEENGNGDTRPGADVRPAGDRAGSQ
jgi:DNA-binding SARP family transcriptional activator/tetratricopeptide (TPR) repeat protein